MAKRPGVQAVQSLGDMVRAILAGVQQPATVRGQFHLQPPPMPTPTPPGTDPRAYIPATGANLVPTPRKNAGLDLTAFDTLKALAAFDLVRVVIEDVKGQVLGMTPEVAPKRGREKASGLDGQMEVGARFLDWPDPLAGLCWRDWLSGVLEEILVTDALTLLPRYTRGGQFIGVEQVDGSTIVCLVDERGRPPLPPRAAR